MRDCYMRIQVTSAQTPAPVSTDKMKDTAEIKVATATLESAAAIKAEFKKIVLPDGKILHYKPKHPDATAIFCDFDWTIAKAQLHANIFYSIDAHANRQCLERIKGESLTQAQIQKMKEEIFNDLKKKLSADEKFLIQHNESVEVRGVKGKCKTAIEDIQKQGGMFTISTFSDYPIAVKLFLENQVGLDADFLICDISSKICGEDNYPKFTLYQDSKKPKENLIIIVSGTPNNAGDPAVTKMSIGHYDMGIALLRFLGLKAQLANTVVVDDSDKHLTAAQKKSITTVLASTSDVEGAYWDEMVKKTSKLHSEYQTSTCVDSKVESSKDQTGKYVGLMEVHPGVGLDEKSEYFIKNQILSDPSCPLIQALNRMIPESAKALASKMPTNPAYTFTKDEKSYTTLISSGTYVINLHKDATLPGIHYAFRLLEGDEGGLFPAELGKFNLADELNRICPDCHAVSDGERIEIGAPYALDYALRASGYKALDDIREKWERAIQITNGVLEKFKKIKEPSVETTEATNSTEPFIELFRYYEKRQSEQLTERFRSQGEISAFIEETSKSVVLNKKLEAIQSLFSDLKEKNFTAAEHLIARLSELHKYKYNDLTEMWFSYYMGTSYLQMASFQIQQGESQEKILINLQLAKTHLTTCNAVVSKHGYSEHDYLASCCAFNLGETLERLGDLAKSDKEKENYYTEAKKYFAVEIGLTKTFNRNFKKITEDRIKLLGDKLTGLTRHADTEKGVCERVSESSHLQRLSALTNRNARYQASEGIAATDAEVTAAALQ